ncbi:MAG: HEAT repeat domain-containing protein [Thermoguttaceae bacterium]|nr:HEAT repeat domain-containing protein [Thermoguttaceae bacterium]
MTISWKQIALGAVAALFVAAASASFGQSPAEKLAECLPKMAAEDLANEEQVLAMEAANNAWETYFLRDCAKSKELRAESLKATCDALESDAPVLVKERLLRLLQWAGDDTCVDVVAKFLDSDEPALVDAAARVLSQIPTEKALAALRKDPVKFAPYIDARDVDVSIGGESELPESAPCVSDAEFDAYMAAFDQMSDDDKARALWAVRVRNAAKYLDLAIASAQSENPDVKRAALLAIERIGSAAQFELLYKGVKEFDRAFCARVMQNVVGDDFDKAVLEAIAKETDPENLVSLAEIAAGRYETEAASLLLALAKKPDCPVRLALLTIAEKIATPDDFDDFVDVALAVEDRAERDRAEQIVARLCEGDASPVIAKINQENGARLFLLIGRIGGDAALAQVDRALKSGDPNAVAIGARALCNWPSAVVWERLLSAAKSETLPESLRIQSLRAFVRVISLPDDRDEIDMTGLEKLDWLKKAFDLATRDEDRAWVLERVGSVREPESVEFALRFVDDEKLSSRAIETILALGHHTYLRKQNRELFLKALDVAIKKGDPGQYYRAEGYLTNMR